MDFKKYTFDELDLDLIFYVRDELQKVLGQDTLSAIHTSGFLELLQDEAIYVHHFDEKYWAEYIVKRYEKKEMIAN